jgi:hypothetical protein
MVVVMTGRTSRCSSRVAAANDAHSTSTTKDKEDGDEGERLGHLFLFVFLMFLFAGQNPLQ